MWVFCLPLDAGIRGESSEERLDTGHPPPTIPGQQETSGAPKTRFTACEEGEKPSSALPWGWGFLLQAQDKALLILGLPEDLNRIGLG